MRETQRTSTVVDGSLNVDWNPSPLSEDFWAGRFDVDVLIVNEGETTKITPVGALVVSGDMAFANAAGAQPSIPTLEEIMLCLVKQS